MNRWMAAGIVGLVFLSGVGVGSLATLALSDAHRGALRHDRPHLLIHERFLERRLDLTAEQTDALRQLREQHEDRMRTLRPRLREQVEGILDRHLAEVYEVLDDQQRLRLQEMIEERRRRRQRHHRDRPARG